MKHIRDAINNIVERNQDKVDKWLIQVGEQSPEKGLKLCIQLIDFVVPRYEKVEAPPPPKKKEISLEDKLRNFLVTNNVKVRDEKI